MSATYINGFYKFLVIVNLPKYGPSRLPIWARTAREAIDGAKRRYRTDDVSLAKVQP